MGTIFSARRIFQELFKTKILWIRTLVTDVLSLTKKALTRTKTVITKVVMATTGVETPTLTMIGIATGIMAIAAGATTARITEVMEAAV